MFTQPLVIGSTYRLKFKSTFEQHGVCSTPGVTCLHQGGGVFRLEQITNFRDLVLAGIKLYDTFFKPVGITQDEYAKYFDGKPDDVVAPEYTTQKVSDEITDAISQTDKDGNLVAVERHTVRTHEIHVETGKSILKRHYKDKINYASYPIYKFVDVIDTNDVIWVPELTLAEFPEIDIREYKDLSLVVHLGYIDTPNKLDPMLLAIRERMAVYGWRPSLIKLYATDSKWMGPAEYDRIKNLRVPATIEVIDENNRNMMVGEMAIVNGQFKKLVNKVVDPSTELAIGSIAKKKQIIDGRMFRVQCADGDVFVTGDHYYVQDVEQNIASWKLLIEGLDYTVGNPCVAYRLATASELADDTVAKYTRSTETHRAVEYGKHGEYDPDSLMVRHEDDIYIGTTDTVRDMSKTYYVEDDGHWREAVASDFDEEGQFKTATGITYCEYQGKGYVYDPATEEEIADPSLVLYVAIPYTYTKTTEITSGGEYYVRVLDLDSSDTPTGYTSVYKEVFSTVSTHDAVGNIVRVGALDLMGFKFDYDDEFGQAKSMTLQLEDIIEAAYSELNVVLPVASFDYDKFWKRFEGRLFRWTRRPAGTLENDPSVTETIETVINEDTISYLSQKAGILLGQSGQIYKEIYVKDSGQQKRNYYMQYVIQSKTVDDQKRRIAELEAALLQLQATNADQEATIQSLRTELDNLRT